MQNLDQSVDRTAFVWALGSLCQLHKIPFDANLLLQQITPPYNVAGLLNAGQQLGLKIKVQSTTVRDLTALPLPCIALMQRQTGDASAKHEVALTPSSDKKIEPTFIESENVDEESPKTNSNGSNPATVTAVEPAFSLVLILRADQDRVLCISAGEQNPSLMPNHAITLELALSNFF